MTLDALRAEYGSGFQPFHYTAADGLALYGRDYGDPAAPSLPVLCLPGLTRNSKDFHVVARALSDDGDRPRRVLCLDFRGRGQSAYDPDPSHYNPNMEAADVQTALAAAGISRFLILGTSRGGIVGFVLAAMLADRIAGLIVNDVGPVLELEGLQRIKGYVGAPKSPADWQAAIAAVKAINSAHFTALSEADWLRFAFQIFRDGEDGPALDYDAAIGQTLPEIDPSTPLPDLWPLYDAIDPKVALMAIRGANSDLLSASTVDEMARRRTAFDTVEVPDQGHAPLLWDAATIAAIKRFAAAADD